LLKKPIYPILATRNLKDSFGLMTAQGSSVYRLSAMLVLKLLISHFRHDVTSAQMSGWSARKRG
jgi:hypothetical protein